MIYLKFSTFRFMVGHSQCCVVGASHSKQPLQGMGSIGVLYSALCLQVSDQQRNSLQQLLLRTLEEKDK